MLMEEKNLWIKMFPLNKVIFKTAFDLLMDLKQK